MNRRAKSFLALCCLGLGLSACATKEMPVGESTDGSLSSGAEAGSGVPCGPNKTCAVGQICCDHCSGSCVSELSGISCPDDREPARSCSNTSPDANNDPLRPDASMVKNDSGRPVDTMAGGVACGSSVCTADQRCCDHCTGKCIPALSGAFCPDDNDPQRVCTSASLCPASGSVCSGVDGTKCDECGNHCTCTGGKWQCVQTDEACQLAKCGTSSCSVGSVCVEHPGRCGVPNCVPPPTVYACQPNPAACASAAATCACASTLCENLCSCSNVAAGSISCDCPAP